MGMIYYNDGSYFDDTEGSQTEYKIECQLNPSTYQRLCAIAHDEGIRTFDISKVINHVIENYNKKNK